ncbi:hypothetical protein NR798_05985 [Archangium gephyra]|uniref:kelch repeat-containing protein n=1 Tax=Archangium gephyra TaxID=48 RepID=UPI0035D40659
MGLTILLAAALAVIAASCSVQTPEAEKPGQSEAALSTGWLPTTQMPEQRRFHSATVLTSDKVLVVGGWGYSGLTRSAATYDPASETWSPAGELTLAREAHTATRLPSGKVLVVGGETFLPPTGYTNTAELYDPATNSWSPAGAMSEARGYNTATLLSPSNKVLVVGGLRGGAQQTVDLYDVATGTWSTAASLLEPRHSHTAVRLASGKVLVAGGWAGGALLTTELYEPTTNSWSPSNPLTTARYGHTATELPNGKILVAGGRKDIAPGTVEFTATAELYDPSTQTWTPAGSLVGARGFHTATLVAGKVFVTGGRGPGDVALATAEVYDPATNTWSSTDAMLGARSDHATVYATAPGKVLVLGGSTHAPLETAEVYDACGLITCNAPPPGPCYQETGTCAKATCTYALKSAGATCDDGNASTTGDTCDASGACTGCGDGVKNGAEACDDGNTTSETSCPYGQPSCTTCNATCTTVLNLSGPYCGDRAKNGAEVCDDGNTVTETSCPYGQASCTSCNASCTAALPLTGPYCGDATKNGAEACDDGNTVTETSCPYGQASCTSCNASCTAVLPLTGPYCGDGMRNGAETCDDGNTTSETSCPYGQASCTRCNSSCTTILNLGGPYCGDGTRNGSEVCDDGNTTTESECPYGQASCTRCNASCTATLYLTGEVPSADCSSRTVSWSQSQPIWNGNPSTAGTYTCSGTVPAASHGATNVSATLNSAGSTRVGSARYTCNDGSWELQSGYSCDGAVWTATIVKCSDPDPVVDMWIGWYVEDLKRCADRAGLDWWVGEYKSGATCKFANGFYSHTFMGVTYGNFISKDGCWRDAFRRSASNVGEYPVSHITAASESSLCGSPRAAAWTNIRSAGNGCKNRP